MKFYVLVDKDEKYIDSFIDEVTAYKTALGYANDVINNPYKIIEMTF